SYSEVVRAHVAQFLENARNWASESKLSVRVRGWHDHLEPILQEQEARPNFDLREYESILVNEFDTLNQRRSFEYLVDRAEQLKQTVVIDNMEIDDHIDQENMHGMRQTPRKIQSQERKTITRWQVCRLFLTTLVLANTGTIEIEDRGDRCDSEMEFERR